MAKYAGLFRDEIKTLTPQDHEESSEPALTSDEAYAFLFVDDEPGVLKALRRIFDDENYRIFTAETAVEALEILEKGGERHLRQPGKSL